MLLTVAYLTFRERPHFGWFTSSLFRELRAMPDVSLSEDLQVIAIDARLWAEDGIRRLELARAAHGLPFEHHPPKPSVWQGPWKQTTRDYFCAAAARNTALAYARGRHVAFVDDLSVLRPGWLKAHHHAATHGYVLCGTTCKQKRLVVGYDGEIVSYEVYPPGQDSRLKMVIAGAGPQRCAGSWLFGGTFSVPLEWALTVNGLDEIHDTIGGEDYDFGIRLERAGASIYIDPDCGTFEDEDAHHAELPMLRLDKPWAGAEGPYSSNYLLGRLLSDSARSSTIGNKFDLRAVRETVLHGGDFPPTPSDPQCHWVDGQPLSEL